MCNSIHDKGERVWDGCLLTLCRGYMEPSCSVSCSYSWVLAWPTFWIKGDTGYGSRNHSTLLCLGNLCVQSLPVFRLAPTGTVRPSAMPTLKPTMSPHLVFGSTYYSSGKESACDAGDQASVPGSGRSSGEGNGNPLQYACLKNSWTEKPGRLQFVGSQRVRHN